MNLKHLLLLLLIGWVMVQSAFLTAQTNQYLHFDRSNDYVRLDDGSQYIANTTAFSMAGWFYTDQLAYGQGMIGFRGTSQGFYLIQLSNGILESRLITDAGFHEYVGPAFTILPGVWQHVAWVYDGASVKLFIDGVEKGSTPASGQITATDIPFTIGRSILTNLNFYFGGGADEVSVWDKALSQTDLQDMMNNELTGNEANLQLYYKFNQGSPCGDNSTINSLVSEVGGGTRDADLIGFALNGGCSSNFDGTLQAGFQAISFSEVPDKLTSDMPFDVHASASSGLPVSFDIISGPATVSDSTVTLSGAAGTVVIAANQYGDASWDTASSVVQSFDVVDPQTNTPRIDLRSPLPGLVVVPELSPIQLAAIVTIDYEEMFDVGNVEFQIDSVVILAKDWQNGHFTAWWEPPSYGSHDLTIRAFNSFGASIDTTVSLLIIDIAGNETATAFSDIWINSSKLFEEVEAELPSFLGAFDQVTATLSVACPPGGCGPWDRVAKVHIQTHEGEWVEMIRYITPYGVECSHTLDVTDFVSALQGKIRFRMSCETFDNGFEYTLALSYQAGTPAYKYSRINPVWHQTFDFGNPGNLQPVDTQQVAFPPNTQASTFKLLASGHGWGENNTDNAAEFYEATHHVWVDGQQTFAHHNWLTCNPNPDGCQPQNGTWPINRAGFCPGHISPWFDYDMGPYISNGQADLTYIMDEAYVDDCHANNPNCVNGATCPNCNDGFNPHLIMASSLINFSDIPFDPVGTTSLSESLDSWKFEVYPNPSTGILRLELSEAVSHADIRVVNLLGVEVVQLANISFSSDAYELNLGELTKGMYMIVLTSKLGMASQAVLLK
ncbi:MAG: LamG-like jellyroll fold domain-containing protein [Bacteroidota bacterium]